MPDSDVHRLVFIIIFIRLSHKFLQKTTRHLEYKKKQLFANKHHRRHMNVIFKQTGASHSQHAWYKLTKFVNIKIFWHKNQFAQLVEHFLTINLLVSAIAKTHNYIFFEAKD